MQEVNFNFNNILDVGRFDFSRPVTNTNSANAVLSDLFGSMATLFEMLGSSQFGSGGCIPQGGTYIASDLGR